MELFLFILMHVVLEVMICIQDKYYSELQLQKELLLLFILTVNWFPVAVVIQ
jgi:hypothetical protein